MTVPLFNLKPENDKVRADVDAAFARVLDSGRFILGEEVESFENAYATFLGAPHAVGVSSGTCALITSLLALGVAPGDEVVLPAFTFGATAMAVRWVGARPVFADIDPATFNLSLASLREAITDRTRATIPVHLYGLPADMDGILSACRERNVKIVEDAAQSMGASVNGRQTGTQGDLGCYSFYPTKPLGGYGDGGLVSTADDALASAIRVIRGQGDPGGYRFERLGSNFRLDALQAAALFAKLPHAEAWRVLREKAARWYAGAFGDAGLGEWVTPAPVPGDGVVHAWALYVIRARDRDGLATRLREKGIGCGVYYPAPLHVQKAFADCGFREGDFPESEKASREVLALPMFSGLTEGQVAEVVEAIRAYYRG
jgi:dTDP-4-amino-4,6-dideoxygalactose transaminase